MKDHWKRLFIKKMLWCWVPGLVLLGIVLVSGATLSIPFFIPVFAFLIAFPLVELMGHYFPDLFFARQWRDRPKPTFSVIRAIKREGRFEQALEELRLMAKSDAQCVDIWLEMLEIALIDLKDKSLGENIYREAYSILESEENRRLVRRFYSNIV